MLTKNITTAKTKHRDCNSSWLLSSDPLERFIRMGKKVDYKVDYKKELAEALDEKYGNIY